MESEPTSAPLRAGHLARLRGRRAAARGLRVDDGALVPPAAAAVAAPPGPAAPRTLADVPRLVSVLTRHGHAVRVSDRTGEVPVPAAVALVGCLVVEDLVAVLVRCAASDQRVHVRLRTEDDELVVAVQTLPDGDRPKPLVLTPRDEQALRRRIEGAAGRATIRTTHGGNWLAMARLPLRP